MSQGSINNLFNRVSKYLPSESIVASDGKRHAIDPKENFCTESFAYFLCESPELLSVFLELVGFQLRNEAWEVLTQHSFKNDEGKRRQVDMVIRSSTGFLIAVEIKFFAPFQPNQLQDNKKWADGNAVLLAPLFRLAQSQFEWKPLKVKPVSWEAIQRLLENFSRTSPCSLSRLAKEFSSYLCDLGYKECSMLQSPSQVGSIKDFASLMDEWVHYLRRLREQFSLRQSGRLHEPTWNERTNDTQSSFFGICGPANSYAGFEVTDKEALCYYQETFIFTGDRPGDLKFSGVFIEPSEDGETIWMTAKQLYPAGDEEKTIKLDKIFLELRKRLEVAGRKLNLQRRANFSNATFSGESGEG